MHSGGFPWLSLSSFSPCGSHPDVFRDGIERSDGLRLAATLADLLVALPLWWLFDSQASQMQFIEHVAWITSPPIYYSLGLDGISLPLVLMTAAIMPLCVLVSWNAITTRVQGFHGHAASHGNGHAGGIRRAGFRVVLCVLGGHADSDVPPHRRLGRTEPPLCGHQVLPLYPGRQRPLLGRHPRPVLLRRAHVRYPRAEPGHLPCFAANVALPGVLRRLRREGPHVSVSHLAARMRTSKPRPPAASSWPACS